MNSLGGKSLISSEFEGRAQLCEGPSGLWIVQDAAERKGGFFRDREAAIAFIRTEFEEPGQKQ
jgi:hypothetical protein